MSGTRIHLTGADTAAYESAMGQQSRVVAFSDGVPRHITLTNWEWEVFDREHAQSTAPFLLIGAYISALMFLVRDEFNGAATPRGRTPLMSNHAVVDGRASTFNDRLRMSLRDFIAISMPQMMAQPEPANK